MRSPNRHELRILFFTTPDFTVFSVRKTPFWHDWPLSRSELLRTTQYRIVRYFNVGKWHFCDFWNSWIFFQRFFLFGGARFFEPIFQNHGILVQKSVQIGKKKYCRAVIFFHFMSKVARAARRTFDTKKKKSDHGSNFFFPNTSRKRCGCVLISLCYYIIHHY